MHKFRDAGTLNFIQHEIDRDTPVAIKKEFHTNGNIKFKYLEYHKRGLKIGYRYEFNEAGEFVKETDLEEGYKFRFIGVLKYLIANEVDLPDGAEWMRARFPRIQMLVEDNKKVWAISYRKFRRADDGTKELYVYYDILDGQTGKLIKSSSLPFVPYKLEWLFKSID